MQMHESLARLTQNIVPNVTSGDEKRAQRTQIFTVYSLHTERCMSLPSKKNHLIGPMAASRLMKTDKMSGRDELSL